MSIQLTTLGGLRVFKDGKELEDLRSWKRRLGLLVYIAYRREATRDHLTGMFWPGKPEQKARSSLSTAVGELRRACGRGCVETHGGVYRAGRELELDATLFQSSIDRGEFKEALSRYHGPFLSGISLVQTSSFQQWVGSVQSRLTAMHRRARLSEIESLTRSGSLPEALGHARRWVELEPEDDGPVQIAMRLLAMDGRRAEALQQYAAFQQVLALLGEEPLPETTELAERIRTGKEVGPTRIPTVIGAAGEQPMSSTEGLRKKRAHDERGTGKARSPPEPLDSAGDRKKGPDLWVVELVETLKDWWVFRGALAFFTFAVVSISIADGLGVPPVTVRKLLAMALGLLVLLAPAMWAVEPWARRMLGFEPPRRWRKASGDHPSTILRRPGLFLFLAAAAGVALGVFLWPRNSQVTADIAADVPQTRLAILPVLPTDSTDEELIDFAEAVSQQTIGHFRTFQALRVPNWRRVAGYRDPTLSPDSILRELDVEYFLSGMVSRVGDSLHFRWDLEDGRSVGEQFDLRMAGGSGTNQLNLLKDIVDRVTMGVRQELGEIIESRSLRLGTASQEAWIAFAEGRRMDSETLSLMGSNLRRAAWAARQADSLFALAASVDPAWADPLIMRATGTQHLAATGVLSEQMGLVAPLAPDPEERTDLGRRALEYLDEALSLDPGNRDALYSRAVLLLDWSSYFEPLDAPTKEEYLRRAEEDLQRAARGIPPHPESMGLLAILLARDRGDYLQASRYGREALKQDPWLGTRRDVIYWLATALFELGEDEDALSYCADATRPESHDSGTIWMRAECRLMIMALGDLPDLTPDPAWTLLERTVLRAPEISRIGSPARTQDFRDRGLLLYAGVLEAAGLPDSARVVLSQVRRIEASRMSAGTLARLGRKEEGLEKLREYLQSTPGADPERILNSRALRFLRGYPPFDSLRVHGSRSQPSP